MAFNKKEITTRFLSFLKNQAAQAHSVYILGDLFDTWVGDDDNTGINKPIKSQLKKLTLSGVQVFLQQGNRDFLLGDHFCQETGITLLDEYAVIDLYGVNTLLTHGDLLCTDDLPYQDFRKKSHTQEWQDNVLSKPLILRLLVARWYRVKSYFHKRKKSQGIMDVSLKTVIAKMEKHQCYRLIHGHTHRQAVHDFTINNTPAQRFVLAEWKKDSASLLQWDSEGYTIKNI